MTDKRRGVLEGAFSLLEALASTGEAGLTRLAVMAGLPKATAHRLLDQLVALGAVRRRDGRYRIAAGMLRLGQAWQPIPALRGAARHPLRQLAAAARGATVVLCVPEETHTVVVAGVPGEVDELAPVGAGTVFSPGNGLDILLAADTPGPAPAPERYTGKEWSRLVTCTRELGVAFQYEDLGDTVCCVSAPVRAYSGEIVAAVGAAVFDVCRLGSMAPAVRRAADMISANLAKAGPALT